MIDPNQKTLPEDTGLIKQAGKRRKRRKREVPEPEDWRPLGYEW